MSKEIHDLKVLGIKIGTHTGWDQSDTMVFNFYGFQSVYEVAIRSCDVIFIDYDDGTIQGWPEEDVKEPIWSLNAFDVINRIRLEQIINGFNE